MGAQKYYIYLSVEHKITRVSAANEWVIGYEVIIFKCEITLNNFT